MAETRPSRTHESDLTGAAEEVPGLGGEPPRQDGFRRVYLGQVADPLIPPHPGSPEAPEDELTQAALEDPGTGVRDIPLLKPTLWRVVFLLVLAVFALAVVFWKH
jgi:hypothetical protein